MTSKENLNVQQSRYIPKENLITLNSDEELGILTYTDNFTQHSQKINWLENPQKPGEYSSNNIQYAETSVITQAFYVPLEEEKCLTHFDEGRQAKFYLDIMERTGANLELTFVKDHGLYITVSGNPETVMKAQKEIFACFQENVLTTMPISKEQHCFVTSKTRDKLQDLEQKAAMNTDFLCPHTQNNWINNGGTHQVTQKSPYKVFLTPAEKDKCVTETLHAKKTFHPLFAGPYSKTTDSTIQETEAYIHIPPSSANEIEIVFNRRKSQVDQAESCVRENFENTKMKTTIDMEMKSQHNCTIGPKHNSMQEILERTGVSIEILPSDSSTSDSVTHQGEPESTAGAFIEAYWKAKGYIVSSISAPSWLHRFIIGKKGQNISKVTQNMPRVHIEFTGEDKIILKGPVDDVNYAQKEIENMLKDLINRMDYEEIRIDYKFHKYLIEKNGVIINRIKEKNKVSVLILPENEKNILIRIEGEHLRVQQAKKELTDLAANFKNEHRKDLIIEQRFHHTIIGKKGERIHDIRKKFPEVMINFPHSSEKSDIVQLIGPKHELEKCTEYLENVVTDIIENSYSITIPIFKKLHKSIIGKGGINIKKICAASNTKINFPSASSNSENIVICGKPENCEIARNWILSIQKDIANISEVEIFIPSNLHKSLIDSKECLISSIMEECGKIHIHFPRNNLGLQKVIIRGPAESVEKAKEKLLQLAEEKQTKSYSTALHVKPQYHQFLLSKNGGNVSKICAETGVRVIFPTFEDKDQELLTLTGKEEAVNEAQKELEALVEDLDNVVEDNMLIHPKYHHHFIMRRGQVLRDMTEEYGGVIINFSCSGKQSNKVTIKGAKPCVEAAKKHILEIIGDLDAQVTTECVIPQKFHRFVMGPMCSRIRQIARDYNVQIKFPDKERPETNIDPAVEENVDEMGRNSTKEPASISPRKRDTIFISGRKEKCEAAMEALKSLIPITAEVHVPAGLHRYIVGQKGSGIRKLIDEFEVNIQVSEPGLESDVISIRGLATNVEQAKARLQERVKALQTEIEDRALRNFKLIFTLDPKYHSKIIGRKGLVVAHICLEYDVTIHFPVKESNEIQDQIIITGYKNNTLAARDEIMRIVQKIERTVTKQIPLNCRVHGHIIGFRGKVIHKIMNQFQVDIHFPPKGSSNSNVTVTGQPDNVKKTIDHLLNLEEHYLSTIINHEYQQDHIRSVCLYNASMAPSRSFAIKDVPCTTKNIQNPPDMNNSEDFPILNHRMSPKTYPWRQ
ncbi:Vigilin [Sciurus carolinensis]|uniref:Vigilin n=1 Tax=Sciurus carolinensis TaxID=30640 RepID=A0AA41NB47_SCICA|nr:Vigilin [Sciurus carolinensis]